MRTSTPITALRRPANGAKGPVSLTTASGEVCEFDAVVLATHSDISLSILGKEATEVRMHAAHEALPALHQAD